MAGNTEPRFRLKSSGGSEILLASVEDLSQRLEEGGIHPDALLFDSGTGRWIRAAESPVVRFIVEELDREGRAPEAFLSSTSPNPTAGSSWVVREKPGSHAMPPTAPAPAPPPPPKPSASPKSTRSTSHSPESPRSSESPGSPSSLPEAPAGKRGAPSLSSPRARTSSPSRRGVTLVLVGLLMASLYLFVDQLLEARPSASSAGSSETSGGRGAAPPGGTGTDSSLSPGVVAQGVVDRTRLPEPPAGLEPEVERIRQSVARRFQSEVDALRGDLDLPASSPPVWLSGTYLAEAGDFPAVREFWSDYGVLLDELRGRDRFLYFTAVRDGVTGSQPEVANQIEGYFRERYEALREGRHDRYRQLILAAARAVELHDFLAANSHGIRYTPALGEALPTNPVLEAEVLDPEIRRELNLHLDRVLEALDRSTGPGAPPADGLTVDLFRRFGEG
ncbi:MAG: hypothetical protein WEA09_00720 [Gemmatimonadota bacterium]